VSNDKEGDGDPYEDGDPFGGCCDPYDDGDPYDGCDPDDDGDTFDIWCDSYDDGDPYDGCDPDDDGDPGDDPDDEVEKEECATGLACGVAFASNVSDVCCDKLDPWYLNGFLLWPDAGGGGGREEGTGEGVKWTTETSLVQKVALASLSLAVPISGG
jgi:hypothetical protein